MYICRRVGWSTTGSFQHPNRPDPNPNIAPNNINRRACAPASTPSPPPAPWPPSSRWWAAAPSSSRGSSRYMESIHGYVLCVDDRRPPLMFVQSQLSVGHEFRRCSAAPRRPRPARSTAGGAGGWGSRSRRKGCVHWIGKCGYIKAFVSLCVSASHMADSDPPNPLSLITTKGARPRGLRGLGGPPLPAGAHGRRRHHQ